MILLRAFEFVLIAGVALAFGLSQPVAVVCGAIAVLIDHWCNADI